MFYVNPDARNTTEYATEKACAECGDIDNKLKRCGKCKQVWYCGFECQKKAWPEHKKVCEVNDETKTKPVLIGDVPFLNTQFLSQYSQIFSLSSTPGQAPQLTQEQLQDAQRLVSVESIDDILDRGPTEKYVKGLGQTFFDKYKAHANGDSMAGKKAVQDICNWVAFNTTDSKQDAKKRKAHIECAWDGIGDKNWRWMH